MNLSDIRKGAQSLIEYLDGGGSDLGIVLAQLQLLRDRVEVIKEQIQVTEETVTAL
jgi:hypothetical protein